jgi:uncharacterized protein YndB with AHSA1/START domain
MTGALATARVEHVLQAPPATVYRAWVDARTLAAFVCPAPGTARVDADPRVGGRLRIAMTFPDRCLVIDGEYLTLDPPNALSFTWRPRDRGYESVVSVALAPHGDGGTRMTIVHSRLPRAVAGDYRGGWARVGAQLAAAL